MVWSDPQPAIGARTRLYTSNSMPPVTSTAPCESKAVPLILPLPSFASRAIAPAATMTQTGGLTKKTHRQPGPCEINPPRKTPAAAATPLMAPQAPSAVLRSLPSRKLVVSSDSAAAGP